MGDISTFKKIWGATRGYCPELKITGTGGLDKAAATELRKVCLGSRGLGREAKVESWPHCQPLCAGDQACRASRSRPGPGDWTSTHHVCEQWEKQAGRGCHRAQGRLSPRCRGVGESLSPGSCLGHLVDIGNLPECHPSPLTWAEGCEWEVEGIV